MDYSKKIVTQVLIEKLWTDEEDVDASRKRYLTKREIQDNLISYRLNL